MRSDIFEHFIPLSFPMGHMGSFLLNFLHEEKNYKIKLSEPGGLLSNLEWQYIDPFDSFFGRDHITVDKVIYPLSNTYQGSNLEKISGITIMNIKYFELIGKPLITKDVIHDPENPKYQAPLEDIILNSSPYIKYHPVKDNSIYGANRHDLYWAKKKILCRFPKNRSWLAFILLLYKVCNSNKGFGRLMRYLNSPLYTKFYDLPNIENQYSISVEDYHYVNIYDLVVNKDLSSIYKMYPKFEFTSKKQQMLDLANKSFIEVVEYFDLDHSDTIDQNFSLNDYLTNQKVVDLIKRYHYLQFNVGRKINNQILA